MTSRFDMTRPGWAMSAAATVGVLVTLAAGLLPESSLTHRNAALHLVLQTSEALVGALAAYLAMARHRRLRRADDALLSAGLVVLATCNLVFGAGSDVAGASTVTFAIWAGLAGRLAGTGLLLAAAFAPARRGAWAGATDRVLVLAPLALVALVGVVVALLEPQLPAGVAVRADAGGARSAALDVHPVVPAVQVVAMLAYALAAVGFARRAVARDDEFLGLLAVACVLGAASRANYALYPSLFTDYVSVGDAFRLGFYALVLVGATREIGRASRGLADLAAVEERRRIARDLHDGLAQELASIGRNLAWVEGDDPFVARARASAERGLADSRRAISALSGPWAGPVGESLGDAVRAVAAREGVELVLHLDSAVRLGPVEREALVRIAAEAVTNAARHGDGSLVRVTLTGGEVVRLRVEDAGPGFDRSNPRRTDVSGFGLTSMQERAEEIGAHLHVVSEPGYGTLVEVVL